jgi:hypothetical protein
LKRQVPPEPDRAERQAVDLGGVWIIKRTGEIGWVRSSRLVLVLHDLNSLWLKRV